jgi:cytochrome c oxidase subunit 3
MFTGFQLYEYFNAPFNISDSVYGSAFFMLTGLHGIHVIVGTIFISVAFIRLILSKFADIPVVGFEMSA